MWPKWKKFVLRRLQLRESWLIFFILGIVMMNYPFIHIFNKVVLVLNLPLLYLYLMVGWPLSIFVIYLFTKAVDLEEDEDGEEKR
jgi:hypothetical protein